MLLRHSVVSFKQVEPTVHIRNIYELLSSEGVVTVLSSILHSPLMLRICTFKKNSVACTCTKIYRKTWMYAK